MILQTNTTSVNCSRFMLMVHRRNGTNIVSGHNGMMKHCAVCLRCTYSYSLSLSVSHYTFYSYIKCMYTCVFNFKGFEEYKYYNCSLYSFCNEMRTAIPPSEQPELRMMKTIAHVRKHTHFITWIAWLILITVQSQTNTMELGLLGVKKTCFLTCFGNSSTVFQQFSAPQTQNCYQCCHTFLFEPTHTRTQSFRIQALFHTLATTADDRFLSLSVLPPFCVAFLSNHIRDKAGWVCVTSLSYLLPRYWAVAVSWCSRPKRPRRWYRNMLAVFREAEDVVSSSESSPLISHDAPDWSSSSLEPSMISSLIACSMEKHRYRSIPDCMEGSATVLLLLLLFSSASSGMAVSKSRRRLGIITMSSIALTAVTNRLRAVKRDCWPTTSVVELALRSILWLMWGNGTNNGGVSL